ncbi:hypothetical protein JTB14_001145 [Gonioctena quinquepunctata]|nr:hypothetical protein JTB14_001145 [Gonioctena quinquepunctata]
MKKWNKHYDTSIIAQLEEDTENFIQYQIMSKQQGVPVTLRLRKGVLPHKFQCQKENKPIPVRQAALKRQRLSLVQDTLSQAATEKLLQKPNYVEALQIQQSPEK